MTIEIPLTKGYTAIVDDIDCDLAELKWRGNPMGHTVYVFGLKKVNGKQKTHQIHREIMERMVGRELQRSEIVDHINRNALDNRRRTRSARTVMSTRTTIITVFILGLICGILLTLMWIERNAPTDTEAMRAEWRRPSTARKTA